ncbi:septum formation inhibitor [Azotobacter vinelandii CA]|uniref:Probable septum site-determining protein MinC n=2 Tax=Azotobacter vinelandii TaxID=354 RepID=C1DQM4_AZOVD|nr:septum site-determining protein MinC [Azotobacter vinelandii DJ]AGK12507.1 septum formation inhibitor [Azotobacter vinelandii CA]AGK18289.1 septum formation inhibitor [Azotobacter vinelandii CA6]
MFQLKGSMLAITVLELAYNDLARLDHQLSEKVAQAPNFFQNTPLVLALDKLQPGAQGLDLRALLAICRRHGLRTLAIRASLAEHIAAAQALDLPVLPPSSARERPIAPSTTAATPTPARKPEKPAEPAVRPTRVVSVPVRGGQQIYAPGGDLLVLAPVSAGAELLADGNIHVYAPMRGRALAGIKGNSQARIFCRMLAAELISIAGRYKVAEDLRRDPNWGEAVHIHLAGDVLNITRL